MLILRQSYHGDYVCTLGRVAVSDGDGMDFSSRVRVVKHTWAPVAMSHHVRQ
jgi:hypothetical protein